MSKIFGRDKVIQRIWKLLAEFSILFTAERRVGKTTVLEELLSTKKEGYLIIFSDLEKIDSPLEFINDVLNKTAPFISKKDKTTGWFNKTWKVMEGVEIGGIITIPKHKEKDWKSLLLLTINSICKNKEDTVVFLWDELPYMLQKINAHEIDSNSVDNSSLKIMDTLRSLRQEHKNLRMVFTGSIGLHHVLKTINKESYTSEPVNEMEKVELKSLDEISAETMVRYQLEKEACSNGVNELLVNNIAQQCDYIPFYIERLIRRLSTHDKLITQELLDEEIEYILTDSNDDWELEHFRNRLNTYYKGEILGTNNEKIKRATIAKSILNHCATASTPQSIDDCNRAVKSNYSIDDRDLIIETLNNLVKDHYLQRDKQGKYQFYFSLIKRWWILAEGLEISKEEENA